MLKKVHEYSRLLFGISECQLPGIEALIQSLDEDLQDYDNEFARLELQFLSLKHQRERAQSYGTALRSLRSPLHRLPNELLERIFINVCEDLNVDSWSKYDISFAPFALSSVCSRWRELVITSPRVWTTILVKCRGDPTDHHAEFFYQFQPVVDLYLERSKSLPLNVGLNIEPESQSHEFFRRFINSSTRWKHLSLHVCPVEPLHATFKRQHDFPVLETVSIHRCTEHRHTQEELYMDLRILTDAPKLHTLNIFGVGLAITPAVVSNNITTLTYNTRPDNLNDVLGVCPNLQILAFTDQDNPRRAMTDQSIHEVQKLTSLSILFKLPFRDVLHPTSMSLLTAPAVTSLILALEQVKRDDFDFYSGNISTGFFDIINDFLGRSNCTLTKLVLDGVPMKDRDLVILLKTIPSLGDLTVIDPCKELGYSFFTIITAFVESLHGYRKTPPLQTSDLPIVPNLHSLTMKALSPKFNHESLIRTILSRWESSDKTNLLNGLTRLRSVDLSLSEPVEEGVYKQLFHLRGSGLQFQVRVETSSSLLSQFV